MRPSLPNLTPAMREALCAATAWIYLLLLPCNIRLHGPLFLHDLLAPLFLAAVLLRGHWQRWRRAPDLLLIAFAAWCVLATLTRPVGGRDLYELAAVGYMALLYAFFSRTRLHPRALGLYALAVGLALWAVGVGQFVAGHIESHEAYVGTTLGFLARRYGFTFGNPNLLASFAVLPMSCALLAISRQEPLPGQGAMGPAVSPGRARTAALALLLGLPPILSASRHLLMSAGVVLGWLPALAPAPYRRLARGLSWVALAAAFLLLYLTVLFPFFPLQARFPFINCRTPGMYMIHQRAYLDMALRDGRTALFGLGRTEVVARYPEAVDPALAEDVLAQYHMDALLPSFLVYMDAHNEYLNLGTAFGLPALVILGAFLLALLLAAHRRGHSSTRTRLLTLFVVTLSMACLWDDLLSKRWIWITLALLAASAITPAVDAHSGTPSPSPAVPGLPPAAPPDPCPAAPANPAPPDP